MAAISASISTDKGLQIVRVKGKTAEDWYLGIGFDYHTTLYITRSEAVKLLAEIAAALGATK